MAVSNAAITNGGTTAITLSGIGSTSIGDTISCTNTGGITLTGTGITLGNISLGTASLTDSSTGADGISGAITGSGSVTMAGSGSLTLSGSNSWTGTTTISSGTLVVGGASAIPSGTGNGNVVDNGILDMHGNSLVLNGLSGSGTIDNLSGTGSYTLSVGGNDQTSTFAGVIQDTVGTVSLAKIGAGTLTLAGASTFTGSTTVTAGTLQTGNVPVAALAHRWSFNNSLADSVGGSTATLFGNATVGANSVTSTGSGSVHTNYVSLGTNLLPTTNAPATIELWVTENQAESYSRILDFGSGTGGATNLFWSFTNGTSAPSEVGADFGATSFDPVGSLTVGTEYNMSLVFTPSGASSEIITSYQMDLAGNVLNTNSVTISNWNISDLIQVNDWLGRSEYGDQDANASWDEVRIWDTALSQSQLVTLSVAGPDSTLVSNALPTTTSVSIANGATLDLAGRNQQIASLSGGSGASVTNSGGTVATLTVNLAGGSDTFSGAITGALNITESGTGTLILTGTNTYSGGTTVSGGTLDVGSATSFSATGPITVTGGTLDLGGFTFTTTSAVSFRGGVTQDGTIINNGAAYDAEAGTVSASLQGTAGLNKTTSGSFTLEQHHQQHAEWSDDDHQFRLSGPLRRHQRPFVDHICHHSANTARGRAEPRRLQRDDRLSRRRRHLRR